MDSTGTDFNDVKHSSSKDMNNLFSCTKCSKIMSSHQDFTDHIQSHNVLESLTNFSMTMRVVLERSTFHKCFDCDKIFVTYKALVLHQIKHSTMNEDKKENFIKRFPCPKCNLAFVAESTLQIHMTAHKPYRYKCHCGIGYNLKEDYKEHRRLVHPPTKKVDQANGVLAKIDPNTSSNHVKCPLCKKQIKKVRYVQHYNTIHEGKRMECEICKKDVLQHSYKSHMLTHGERDKKCLVCGKMFVTNLGLTNHMNNVHNADGRTYSCCFCDKTFNTKSNCQLHEKIHKDKREYICDYCDKGFNDPSALLRHKRIHTGDKRYKCEKCPKAFTDAGSLIRHRIRHGKARNHACELCDRRFYMQADLNQHIKVAHTKTTFECDLCGKIFSRKSYLFIHMTGHHMNIRQKRGSNGKVIVKINKKENISNKKSRS